MLARWPHHPKATRARLILNHRRTFLLNPLFSRFRLASLDHQTTSCLPRLQTDSSSRAANSSWASVSSPELLRNLVEQKEYELAEEARRELVKAGTFIPSSLAYENVAAYFLRQDNPDENVLAAWLDLYPEAQFPDQIPCRAVSHELFSEPATNMPYIRVFAMKCVSKGYTTFARNTLLPLITQHTPTHSVGDFVQRLQDGIYKAEHSFLRPTGHEDPKDIEILNHIEELLPARVAATRDGDLFEDSLFENHEPVVPPEATRASQAVFDHLCECITLGKYSNAHRLLTELTEFSGDLPTSPIFLQAANYALGQPLNDSNEALDFELVDKLNHFVAWLQHIPAAHESPELELGPTLKLLLKTPILQLDLLRQFAMICADKGHHRSVFHAVSVVLVQYSDPADSVRFLSDYEDRIMRYYQERTGTPDFTPQQAEEIQKAAAIARSQIRSRGIRDLAKAGHLQAAVEFIPSADTNIRISIYTFDLLLHFLNNSSDKALVELGSKVRDIRALIAADPLETSSRRSFYAAMFSEDISYEPLNDSLPKAMLQLRAALRSPNPPHPFLVSQFLIKYIEERGTDRGIKLLRRVAYRNGYRSASRFASGEILYRYHEGSHFDVLKGFVDRFFIVGLPRDAVLSALGRSDAYSNAKNDLDTVTPTLSQDNGRWAGLMQSKMFPTPDLCAIVWHSLVALSPVGQETEALYSRLIAFTRGAIDDQLPAMLPEYSSVSPLMPPPAWINTVSPYAFTPFIRKLMRGGGLARGPQVLADMVAVGMKPDLYHFTELAIFFASSGEASRAMYILDGMEKAWDNTKWEELQSTTRDHSANIPADIAPISPLQPRLIAKRTARISDSEDIAGPPPLSENDPQVAKHSEDDPYPFAPVSVPRKHSKEALQARTFRGSIPPVDYVFYVSLMRGFMMADRLDCLANVSDRLHRRFLCNPGEDPYLDSVYEDWNYIRRRQRHDPHFGWLQLRYVRKLQASTGS